MLKSLACEPHKIRTKKNDIHNFQTIEMETTAHENKTKQNEKEKLIGEV